MTIDLKTGQYRPDSEYNHVQTEQIVQIANSYPTNLEIISNKNFEIIARHGFECTNATLHFYRKDLIRKSYNWEQV